MDLLLHLVARQEVPIEQVKMSMIAEQYLELVSRQAHRLDLEQASEYLVIAATLLSIKSRSLLPPEPVAEEEDTGPWQDGNPFFESLRARIQEYQLTQIRAGALRRMPQLGVHTFTRVDRKALLPTPEMLQEPEDVYHLGKLFAGLLKRVGNAATGITITLHAVSVVSVMVRIVDGFQSLFGADLEHASTATRKRVGFLEMLRKVAPLPRRNKDGQIEQTDENSNTRSVVIAGFVAVLELAKRGIVSAAQDDANGLTVGPPLQQRVLSEMEPLSSEFDGPQGDQTDASEPERIDNVVHMADYRREEESEQKETAGANSDRNVLGDPDDTAAELDELVANERRVQNGGE